ncbi:MAG: iron-sulfur cluster-binding protein [Candidatus Rokubacteria bacterium GWC2_70_24]|nr:MAG: iron-sulfur cluster-binding protein [Candidatus Rokubacteria bacterium GWC2_70_24]
MVEGIDLPGHWNRMFETRVITDYDPGTLDEITALPGGESLGWCYQCAKCVGVCPVDIVGDYGPRKIHRDVLRGISLLDDPNLWLCTTCSNCLRVCPKEVDMIQIMPAAREAAINAGKDIPAELQKVFEAADRYGNPMGENPRKRADWVKQAGVPVPIMAQVKRPVDVLWYVGSYPSYHPRGMDAARALARIFHALGVDFAILGVEEKEDGDSIRLAGETGLFEKLAEANIKTFARYRFTRLVVFGPHELNAFKNEYPKLGGEYAVQHYTQFLVEHLDRLKALMVHPVDRVVTYHDPCYLSRHNGEYEAPRTLLRAIPGLTLVEMPRNRENGYCCGGGGGGMWLDGFSRDHTTMRLSDKRVMEAAETGARTLSICCPYEVSRFEDAVKATGNDGRLDVQDIAELVDKAMGGGAG